MSGLTVSAKTFPDVSVGAEKGDGGDPPGPRSPTPMGTRNPRARLSVLAGLPESAELARKPVIRSFLGRPGALRLRDRLLHPGTKHAQRR
jgi:hypothetical protein